MWLLKLASSLCESTSAMTHCEEPGSHDAQRKKKKYSSPYSFPLIPPLSPPHFPSLFFPFLPLPHCVIAFIFTFAFLLLCLQQVSFAVLFSLLSQMLTHLKLRYELWLTARRSCFCITFWQHRVATIELVHQNLSQCQRAYVVLHSSVSRVRASSLCPLNELVYLLCFFFFCREKIIQLNNFNSGDF